MDKAIIIGAGTYGQVYAEYLNDTNRYSIAGFLDDDELKIGKIISGIEVLGPVDELTRLQNKGIEAVFAPIGNNETRIRFIKMAEGLGYKTPGFVHPSSNIHRTVGLGKAVYILPGTNIMPHTSISDFVMISMGVNIAHHTVIGEGCFLSMGVNLGASVTLRTNVFLGMASTVMTGVHTIGKDAVIGAGAVVIHDVDENSVVVGNPARVIRRNK